MTHDHTWRWTCLALFLCAQVPAAAQELTLAEAADSALATHPALHAAGARLDGARAGASAARAARLPTIAATGTASRFQEPMVVAPFHGFDLMNPPDFDRTLLQGQLAVQYALFDGGLRGARIRGADALSGATAASRDEAEMQVLEAVSATFLGLASARDVNEAAAAQVQALQAEADRATRRFREGTAAQVEVLRAEAAFQDARAQQAGARASVEVAEAGLARLMGVSAEWIGQRTVRPPVAGDAATSSARGDDSPRVLAARRAVAVAQARVDQERASRLPSVQAGAGLLNFGSGAGDFVTEWQAGLQLSWPVFTGGARSASIRRAEADLRAAQQELRLAELEEGTARDEARAGVVAADARTEAHQAAVTQWEEVARIEALSLSEGAGVQSDFLRAQAALLSARAGLARARNDLVLARVRLAHAQGVLTRDWLDALLENVR